MNSFNGIKLGEANIHIGKMLIPWKNLGILTCINNSLGLEQILDLEQLVELYVYMGVHNYVKGNKEIMTSVWKHMKDAKAFDEYNRDTVGMKKDYSGSGLKRVCELLLDGKEVFCYVDASYRVRFYKQSQFVLQMISNPGRFMGVHGMWINIGGMIREITGIKFQKKKTNDRVLQDLKRIYTRLAKGTRWVQRSVNPSHERIYELIKEPSSEIVIHTNNHGKITSIKQGVQRRKSGKDGNIPKSE